MNDDELMELIKNDDDGAFRILYARWGRRIMSYASRTLQDRAEAEDVVQETFMALYKFRKRYKEKGRLSSFLFRIAGNAVRSRFRSRNPIPVEDLEDFQHDPVYENTADVKIDIEKALGQLPFQQREVLLLAVMGGMTYKEIGVLTGSSESAVAQRICRARRKLYEIMAPDREGE